MHVSSHTSRRSILSPRLRVAPPRLRTFVLAFSVIALLAAIALATPFAFDPAPRQLAAQTNLIDYDTDGDDLIEVSTRAQWAAINHDLDTDGSPTATGTTDWQAAFPNAMTGNGCASTCNGYELANDLDFDGQTFTPLGSTSATNAGFAGTFVGNGFEIRNPTSSGASYVSVFATTETTATISGIGVIEPNFSSNTGSYQVGGIVGRHQGKLYGSYVVGHDDLNGRSVGAIAAWVGGSSVIAHSYARIDVNGGSGNYAMSLGGIIGWVNGGAKCINSYAQADLTGTSTGSFTATIGQIHGSTVSGTLDNTNCTAAGSNNSTAYGNIANMRGAVSYSSPSSNNPFSGFDDTNEDGNTATVDYWDFVGPHDTPVLKAFGHTRNRQAFDYDMDDDGRIDIRTLAQWAAMDEDRNGDGIVDGTASYISPRQYVKGFPGAMNTMGCGATDHDNDPMTPDQPTCTGYELLNDLDFQGWYYNSIPELPRQSYGTPGISLKLYGNGYLVKYVAYHNNRNTNGRGNGIFGSLDSAGRIEGIGFWQPDVNGNNRQIGGAVMGALNGKAVGIYVYSKPGQFFVGNGNQWGGIAAEIIGELLNSFVRGDVGHPATGGDDTAGLFGFAQNGGTCRNSYWDGQWIQGGGAKHWTIAGANANNHYNPQSCYANTTTWWGGTKTAAQHSLVSPRDNLTARTREVMASTDDYTGIYQYWDMDGSGNAQDVWDFGDETELPLLKAYGHDRVLPEPRFGHATATFNLCTRTLPVANEIIRQLKNDTWRTTSPPITARPAAIDALSPCNSNSDTRNVTLAQLRDFVVTTPENPFRLDPGRTSPPSPRITALDHADLGYLPNAAHFDFSDNALTTLPACGFQDLTVQQIDLSNNAITSLPPDAFTCQSKTAVENNANPFAYYGSWIDLSGNRLTTDGIPYRLFDEMPYVTGIDLSNNAITEVNTRWFDHLTNLGRRDPDATTLPRIVGLHLGGNEITGHFYWHKAFPENMRFYEATYSGTNAGNDLRDAIIARINEEKGLRREDLRLTDNLDLETTENLRNGMITSGTCPEDAISGPPGSVDVNNMPVQCQEATRWTPPWEVGTSAEVSAPTTSTTGDDGHIVLSFSHQSPGRGELPITGYQLRYRLLPDDVNAPWMQPWLTVPVDRSYGQKSTTITVLMPLNFYQFQMRALLAGTPGPPVSFAQGTWPEGLEGATAQSPMAEPGRRSIRVTFTHQPVTYDDPDRAAVLGITGYQLRYRPADADPDDPWTRDWHDIDVDVSTPGPKSVIVEPLLEGVIYEFQIRPVSAGPVESVAVTQTTVIALPKANSIRPTIREISVRAGQEVRLEVEVISLQNTLRNDFADDADSLMTFRWTESPSGGGTFATPSTDRRVIYTAPDLPGTYTILAEAQPDGICRDHHKTKLGISAEDRAPCIATITVRVSRAPGAVEPEADPINPAGLIPTSLTDNAGVAYAVFTPVDGGTFTGDNITVTAPEGAIPDQQLLGISAAVSSIPVPPPIPGGRITIAGSYYEVNGVQRTGDAPVSGYTLDDPILACIPVPDMFRADISNVEVVSRAASDGSITILTSSIRQTATGLAACGNIGQLPATIAAANIGIIEATPAPEAPTDEDLPETGGTAPSAWIITLAIITATTAVGIAITTTAARRRRHSGGVRPRPWAVGAPP